MVDHDIKLSYCLAAPGPHISVAETVSLKQTVLFGDHQDESQLNKGNPFQLVSEIQVLLFLNQNS